MRKEYQIKYGGLPRYLVGNEIGIVLVHGLTGAPVTQYWMGEYLNQRGLTVYIPRLSGHGTIPEDMYRLRWRDWYYDVQAGYEMVRENCKKVFISGLSLGGALTLTIGARERPDGLIAMSAPHAITDPLLPFVPFIKYFKRSFKKEFTDTEDSRRMTEMLNQIKLQRGEPPVSEEGWYKDWIIPAIDQTNRMLAEMRRGLPDIQSPTLLMHSQTDTVVPFSDAEKNYAFIGATEKKLVAFESSTHVISRSFEMEQVWETAYNFIMEHA